MSENENLEEVNLEELLKESENKYLRLYADFENYKKRVFKEKQDLVANTKTNMLDSILDIDNDLSIALNSLDESSRDGVRLIINKLDSFLAKNNVEVVQTDTYDSDLHEVIGVNSTSNTDILSVISKGYLVDGKVVRYPKIILGK